MNTIPMLIKEVETRLNIDTQRSKLEKLHLSECEKAGVELFIKRDDLIHPIISGNKWRKLKYILEHALTTNHQHLISMGGAYSNHLHALAYIGKQLGLKTTAYIRGEYKETRTLKDINAWGMELIYVDRNTFRELRDFKHHNSEIAQKHNGYWIPEGGANPLALKGIAELIDEINSNYNTLALACGTGTTLAGVSTQLAEQQSVLGFSSFKGKDFLSKDIEKTFSISNKWSINNDYHFGGFGQYNDELLNFITQFEKATTIQLEQVYTGKLFFGLIDLIQKNYFKSNTKIIALHTGGLQGRLF